MKYLVTFLLITIIAACGTRKNKEFLDPADDNSPITEVYDTLLIDGNMAVLWWPDSNDQVIMKENYDEISYNKFVDDMTFFTQRAVQMFDSIGIENKVTDRDIIVFKKSDDSDTILKRKEVKGNMVLFHKGKEPLVFSMDNYNRQQIKDFYR
ncbi:MAG TPA: hypothetical protein VHI78_06510 [Bacteroidales bacterium]|jgi:hypothetical protein|nr:hypothetical protein [Bacteroidales bacterium]